MQTRIQLARNILGPIYNVLFTECLYIDKNISFEKSILYSSYCKAARGLA